MALTRQGQETKKGKGGGGEKGGGGTKTGAEEAPKTGVLHLGCREEA